MSRSSALAEPVDVASESIRGPGDGEPVALVAELDRLLDLLVHADVSGLADGASVLGVLKSLSRLESVACRQAAVFDSSGEWIPTGAKTSAAWVTTQSRSERRRAKRRLRAGRWLLTMHTTRDAFEAGQIGADHVEILVRARQGRYTAKPFARDEPMLVEWACTLSFDQFRAVVTEWTNYADAEGAETQADRQHDSRRVHLSRSLGDQWFLDGLLNPISGEIVNSVLSGIERELFEADWAAAEQRLGRQPIVADLDRRGPQRRADALVEMASRAAAMPAGAHQPKPLFTILVGEAAFARTCTLASGTVITPGAASRWLTDSVIERVVFDTPDRVLSVSKRRSFTGALRRAIEVRDRTCTHPYCDEPAEYCEVDHIQPWAHGGETRIDNGQLQCGFHNRLKSNQSTQADP